MAEVCLALAVEVSSEYSTLPTETDGDGAPTPSDVMVDSSISEECPPFAVVLVSRLGSSETCFAFVVVIPSVVSALLSAIEVVSGTGAEKRDEATGLPKSLSVKPTGNLSAACRQLSLSGDETEPATPFLLPVAPALRMVGASVATRGYSMVFGKDIGSLTVEHVSAFSTSAVCRPLYGTGNDIQSPPLSSPSLPSLAITFPAAEDLSAFSPTLSLSPPPAFNLASCCERSSL
jgi:hypothetical protein